MNASDQQIVQKLIQQGIADYFESNKISISQLAASIVSGQSIPNLVRSDRFTFEKLIQMLDGRNIQVGNANGTIIATAPTQKLGFHGTTAVVQANAITVPSGGTTVDTQARSAISSLIAVLKNKGFTA